MPKTIVISAVNITEGGTLTILRDCVATAQKSLVGWRIIVMVHDFPLITTPNIEVRVFPKIKESWLKRIWLEWVGFKKISQDLEPDIWLSLHDITPRVIATRQIVYCHNPAIFYKISLREAFLEPKLLLFKIFYGFIYGTFIRKNSYVIVQQQWIRNEFKKRFGNIPIIVAHPFIEKPRVHGELRRSENLIFFYPALPRVFKNIEILGEATKILNARGISKFEIRVTISGSENRYARILKARFGQTPSIHFIGRQNSQQMLTQYKESSAVIFPSKLETWGLPISEAKSFGLPLIVADEPYAVETVGNYDAVSFFPKDRPDILADLMQNMIEGKWIPDGNTTCQPDKPYTENWQQLFTIISDLATHN